MQQINFHSTIWLLAISVLSTPPTSATECSVSSGAHSVALLELYTSEGCSSCPLADHWLSRLTSQGYTSDHVIPLALHVDYWDYIGWQDRFAKPGFAARQREQARLNHSGYVYTPQVMINGRDDRKWSDASRFEADILAIIQSPARASIKLTLSRSEESLVEISASAQAPREFRPVLYIALYENNLTSPIKAGENSATTLHHDYVVREWLGPYTIDDKRITSWQQKIRFKPEWKSNDMGAVAFVQNRETGDILQATALKLCI